MAQKPTLRQLKYLCALADERHLGKAAKRCHVTQSTLSAGIQELEKCLGVALIERGGKGEQAIARVRSVGDGGGQLHGAVRYVQGCATLRVTH